MFDMDTKTLRVLVATDGSAPALRAVALAATVRWPAGTVLEAVGVDEPIGADLELPPAAYEALEREVRARTDAHLADVARAIGGTGREVRTVALTGRAASAIVDEAARSRSHLVIMGSRGRGPIASLVLGSVAAEVVDHAPCPVLVARTGRLERLVVADDGSAEASAAVRLVTTWPIFQGMPTRVVSVAADGFNVSAGASWHPAATQAYAETVEGLRAMHRKIASDTAARLGDAGVPARAELRSGDVAEQIVEAALEFAADCVVMGSRGRTGLERVLLGSVARNVLHQAPCSVLIARGAVTGSSS